MMYENAAGLVQRAVLMIITIFSTALSAQNATPGSVTIAAAWSREMPPAAANGAVYFQAHNSGWQPDRIIGARTDIAEQVEFHTHNMEGGMMKMRKVTSVEIPARSEVMFKPHGLHVMLIGLKQPLVKGERFGLTLVLDKAGEIDLAVHIKPGNHPWGQRTHDAEDTHQMQGVPTSEDEQVVPIRRISDHGVLGAIGTVTLKEEDHGLMIIPDLHGLDPGRHAFHIHENGDCGPAPRNGKMVAGLAAGSHYDHPSHEDHGRTAAGDLPELVVGRNGVATEAVSSGHLTLDEITGRSIMIHAHGEDELPGGGPRIACGIIPAPN